MCGIIGGFDRDQRPFGTDFAEAACGAIRHRGPDDQGYHEVDGMLVGNRRLSILDLAGGHQPMFSDDGQIAVVQNGEIYNYLELSAGLDCRTTCDTEVILRLYERHGAAFVERLIGMFAIAILDRRARRMLLFRDRTGEKPLYYHDDGRRLLFASEIKSLLAVGVPAELDEAALDGYLTFNFVPPPATLCRGIRHVMPGHTLEVDAHGVRERAWWSVPDAPAEERTPDAWCDEVVATLDEAVRIQLRSDVPLGAFLSGGLDSSSVVRLMSRRLERPVQTFSIGFTDPRFDESPYAAQVAELCGTQHRCDVVEPDLLHCWPLTVFHNDQPHGDVSFVPMYWLARVAREQVKVVLTGDGGDELFAGYQVHKEFFGQQDLSAPPADFERAYVRAISLMSPAEKNGLYSGGTQRRMRGRDAFDFAAPLFQRCRQMDPINRALALDVMLLLPGNNLVKPDRMAMAVSLETRAPMLDARLLELAFRIPGDMKFRDGQSKWILKRAAERLLPRDIVHRRKQMFTVPIGEWFKDRLQGFVRDVLLSPRTTERGLFDTAAVARMIDRHAAGTANHTRQIRALIALEVWQRIFLDQRLQHAPTWEELGIEYPGAAAGRMAA